MLEFARLNRAKDAAERAMEYEGKGDFEEMGDESPLFRWVLVPLFLDLREVT